MRTIHHISRLKLSFSQAYNSIVLHTRALNVTFNFPGRFYNIGISRDNIVASRPIVFITRRRVAVVRRREAVVSPSCKYRT